VRVRGTVQGVGFRPFVYRLAGELELAGWVLNDAHGVLIEVEGSAEPVDSFLTRLRSEPPPLAIVESVETTAVEPAGGQGFSIRESPRDERADAPVTPDTATCEDCLAELFDRDDRRYRYPFINCTNCGPRFTIVRGIPYDRPFTTMASFQMCADCQAEYDDPADRRFHAQPNACSACGPSLTLIGADETDPLRGAVAALLDGRTVAVKGIGGYHLACRADDEQAVARLRGRKHREDKPFALMAASLAQVSTLVVLGEHEHALLSGPERPIVLAPRLAAAPVAASVAPGAPELGVMLPYSPLHYLLLADAGCPLVMTSGNLSEEPIAFVDDDAGERLSPIADVLLIHDRPIETRTDDSVVRVVSNRPLFVRRSRGYVPASIPLPGGTEPPLLACGAELKNTFCLARGDRAWVGHHIGDLHNYETLRSFADGIEHFKRLFSVTPEVVAHDLHPEYLSTKYALECEQVSLVAVQHHHAHLAACLAEHGIDGPAVGAIYDGTGYGPDGTIWGGELLVGDVASFRRVGTLHQVRLPGGERAIHEPWRMACAWLCALGGLGADPPVLPPALAGVVDERRWRQVAQLARGGFGAPLTTSMGRLFDAIAALCGIRAEVNYEGQAAIELEAACDPAERGAYELPVGTSGHGGEMLELDPRPLVRAVLADLEAGVAVGVIAARFHAGVARATVEACVRAAEAGATELVVLSGGVFLNRRLVEAVGAGLRGAGLRVLVPERLPPGDGGISYGQAVVAARQVRSES
jgi:hydrogenase maturation protein HypF